MKTQYEFKSKNNSHALYKPGLMTIVFFNGESGYSALNHFTHSLAKALELTGAKTLVIDLADPDLRIEWGELLNNGLRACISFNCIGLDIVANGINVFDAIGIPFFGLLVDHPLHLRARIQTPMSNLIVGTIQPEHVKALSNLCGIYRHGFYLPLAGTQVDEKQPILPFNHPERNIDCLISYSIEDESNFSYGKITYEESLFLEEFENALRIYPEKSFDTLFFEIIKTHQDIAFSSTSSMRNRQLLPSLALLDRKIRSQNRIKLVQALSKSGINISIVGKGWNNHDFAQNVTYLGEVPYEENLSLFLRAKCTVHSTPTTFQNCQHDRVLNAMLRGCLTICDGVNPEENGFHHLKHLLAYKCYDEEEAVNQVLFALKNESLSQEICLNASKEVLKNHTWNSRAKELLANMQVIMS